jgi:2-polyprenyl-3-methyl-5-hydroxy-6-metoxy-1,4-benzoquinol methylase
MSEYSEKFRKYKVFLNRRIRVNFEIFHIPKHYKILDAGCGFGDRMKAIREAGYEHVYGIDIDPHCVQETEMPNVSLGSITATNHDNESFDCVLVEAVFHHISEYKQALDEIERILKPGGCLCIIELRNSIPRKILDFLTFNTPVPQIVGGPWLLRKKLVGDEIKTGLYPLWLKTQKQFFQQLGKQFNIEFYREDPFFMYCKAVKK